MTSIVFLAPNTKEPFTTSDVIAEFAEVKHHAIQQMIQKHESDFKEFGKLAFEMRPLPKSRTGQKAKIYQLNEEQATLLMTYLKNTEQVRAFKKELVRQFYAMRFELYKTQAAKAERKPVRASSYLLISGLSVLPSR